MDRARAYLERHFREPLDLPAVARSAGCSESHLCRIFKRETGVTLSRYLHRLRLAEALARLDEGSVRLIDLAFELGYASHSHFTAVFRRELGRTPSEARRSLLRSRGVRPRAPVAARRPVRSSGVDRR